jgi:hypothetical protein
MSSDGPFSTREQAEAEFAAFRDSAEHGRAGAPGEQLVFLPGQLEYDTITDTLETNGVELGAYDRQVIARLACLLGPLDCAVIDSLFKRAARDACDDTAYVVVPPHLRLIRDPGRGLRAPPAVTIVATVATG